MSFLHHDSNAFRISDKVQVDPSSEALVGWTVGAAWQSFCRFHSRNEPRGHLYHMQMWSDATVQRWLQVSHVQNGEAL